MSDADPATTREELEFLAIGPGWDAKTSATGFWTVSVCPR